MQILLVPSYIWAEFIYDYYNMLSTLLFPLSLFQFRVSNHANLDVLVLLENLMLKSTGYGNAFLNHPMIPLNG